MKKRRQRMTVRASRLDRQSIYQPNSYEVCVGSVVLAKLQELERGRWFMYGLRAQNVPNTANRPDHYDAVKAEATAACRVWLENNPL